MIEPMDRSHRVQTVRITCDACGTNEVVACDYLRGSSSHKWLPNEGHANRKITMLRRVEAIRKAVGPKAGAA